MRWWPREGINLPSFSALLTAWVSRKFFPPGIWVLRLLLIVHPSLSTWTVVLTLGRWQKVSQSGLLPGKAGFLWSSHPCSEHLWACLLDVKFQHQLPLKNWKWSNEKTSLAHYLKNEGLGRLICLLRRKTSLEVRSVEFTLLWNCGFDHEEEVLHSWGCCLTGGYRLFIALARLEQRGGWRKGSREGEEGEKREKYPSSLVCSASLLPLFPCAGHIVPSPCNLGYPALLCHWISIVTVRPFVLLACIVLVLVKGGLSFAPPQVT